MENQADLIDVLERDHRRIDDLAERLDSTSDSEVLRDLFRQIVDALKAHESIEHEVLFPAFRQMITAGDDNATTLDARLGEHDELNSLLDEMCGLDCDCYAFVKRGSALLLELEGHFAREEASVFTPMRERMDPDELLRLGEHALSVKNSTSA
jgi:iron-sulfur cluster repair protein YtfE (RIC family)